MTTQEQLREEWFNYLAMEYYHGDMNVAKRHDANTFADWWLAKLSQATKEVVEQQAELALALIGMYNQYCDGGHDFMSAGEYASSVLKRYGYAYFDEVGNMTIPLNAERTGDKGLIK